jgi:hypothetical protein
MGQLADVTKTFYDDNGAPLALGQLWFYDAGTNTPFTVYEEVGETTPYDRPVTLDANGLMPEVFYTGSARIILTDANCEQVEFRDPVIVA